MAAGGFEMIEIPDSQEEIMRETIHEMPDRLRQLAAMRSEDGPLALHAQRSGSPTEVVDDSATEEADHEMVVSPLVALTRMVHQEGQETEASA